MEGSAPAAARSETRNPFDRLASFRVLYVAIIAFLMAYIVSIEVAETLLQSHFESEVKQATRVSPTEGPIVLQIQKRVARLIHESRWVGIGGVRVQVTVLASDGMTPLFVGSGRTIPSVLPPSLDAAMVQAVKLLPAVSDVFVSVPHGSALSMGLLMGYASVLLSGLFFYNRAVARQEAAKLARAMAARTSAAKRARSIESELEEVRTRLREMEPSEQVVSAEIQALQQERASLRAKLSELAQREAELSTEAARSSELEEERQALEELLEEALEDVSQKEAEIGELQDRLKTAAKKEPGGSSRSREAERLARRMKTLYKNLAFDDRAIADLVALRDDAMKLRAEEALKRLADDSESATVRRKVGGLPPQLSIFELGFAGKGRIYYSRKDSGVYRVLTVGAKNSQQKDLEYLSRLAP